MNTEEKLIAEIGKLREIINLCKLSLFVISNSYSADEGIKSIARAAMEKIEDQMRNLTVHDNVRDIASQLLDFIQMNVSDSICECTAFSKCIHCAAKPIIEKACKVLS